MPTLLRRKRIKPIKIDIWFYTSTCSVRSTTIYELNLPTEKIYTIPRLFCLVFDTHIQNM